TFDNLNLLLAIVFAERALPDHFDLRSLRRKLTRRFDRAGVNALPEFVGGALGNDSDRQLLAAPRAIGWAFAPPGEQQSKGDYGKKSSFHPGSFRWTLLRLPMLAQTRLALSRFNSSFLFRLGQLDRMRRERQPGALVELAGGFHSTCRNLFRIV